MLVKYEKNAFSQRTFPFHVKSEMVTESGDSAVQSTKVLRFCDQAKRRLLSVHDFFKNKCLVSIGPAVGPAGLALVPLHSGALPPTLTS